MIERRANRTYTPEQRAEAVALALVVGPNVAADRLGIPRRTVAAWRSGERHRPEVQAVILESRQALAERMREIVSVASEQVLAGLRDPKQRLSDRVRALEVALEAARLLGAESQDADALSEDEAQQLGDWLRVHAPEIAAAEAEVAALGPGGTDDAD
jgi:transposase-like protein